MRPRSTTADSAMARMRARTRSPGPTGVSPAIILPYEGVTVSTQTDEASLLSPGDTMLMGAEGGVLSARSSGFFPDLRLSPSTSPRVSPVPSPSTRHGNGHKGVSSPSRLTSSHTTASQIEVADHFELRCMSAPPMDSNLSSRKPSDQSSMGELLEETPTMAQEKWRRRSSDMGKQGTFKLKMLEVCIGSLPCAVLLRFGLQNQLKTLRRAHRTALSAEVEARTLEDTSAGHLKQSRNYLQTLVKEFPKLRE